ncbi:MAG: dethiobiotin synthase [Myxococcota bacterium]|nr:dethiobiotin synthase [Myxococcota bacterium]
MKGWFVTGTGTGVGKTYVASALVRRARDRGQRVFGFKPIETGCTWNNGLLEGADQELLSCSAGDWQTGALRGLYRFERPVAPRAAAVAASTSISLGSVKTLVDHGSSQSDLVVVEGAGGWRVPLTDDHDMGTLAQLLGLPIIVVGSAGLGTINHCLLTVEAAVRDGCLVSTVVLSCRPEDDFDFALENALEIGRLSKLSVVVLAAEVAVLDSLLAT